MRASEDLAWVIEYMLVLTGLMFAIIFGGGMAVLGLHLAFGVFGLNILPPC